MKGLWKDLVDDPVVERGTRFQRNELPRFDGRGVEIETPEVRNVEIAECSGKFLPKTTLVQSIVTVSLAVLHYKNNNY